MSRITDYVRIIALLPAGVCCLQGEEAVTPPVSVQSVAAPQRERLLSQQITAALKESLPKYEPPKPVAPKPAEIIPLPNEDIVVMAPVVVTESTTEHKIRLLVEKNEENKAKAEAEKFNWKDGGTFIKGSRAEVMLKYNAEHKGFDLLKLKW